MIHKRIVRYGEYTTKKDRDDYTNNLRASHFLLGNDGENTVSTYVYDYRRFGTEGKDALSARLPPRSDLKLGHGPLERDTSYKVDYPPKQAPLAALDRELIKDLRATHYQLGNEPRSFATIHRQDYVEKELGSKSPKKLEDTRSKMRMQNFKLGDAPVNYQTSASIAYTKPPRTQL